MPSASRRVAALACSAIAQLSAWPIRRAGARLQESGLSRARENCTPDCPVPVLAPETSRRGPLFRRETEMREPVAQWLCAERSPVVVADELDFRFGAPDLLAASAHRLAERLDDRARPVVRLDELALLEHLKHESLSRSDIEALTSTRWSDHERRVLNPLCQEGLVVFDDGAERWRSGRRLAEPFSQLVAVEMKLRDGRRALSQAMRYRAFASESFIAMPRERIDDSLAETCRTRGVGLLAVDETSAEAVVEAVAGAPFDPLLHRLAQELLLARHSGRTSSAPAGSPRGVRTVDAAFAL